MEASVNTTSIWIVVALLWAGSVAFAEPLYLVRDGKARAVIVMEDNPDKSARMTRMAARELQSYLRKITGANPAIQTGKPSKAGPAIHVGRTDFVKGLDLGLDKLDRDGIIVKRIGDNVVLVGREPFGTRQAVRVFLREACGFRWYMPGPLGKAYSKRAEITVDKLDITSEPDFRSRFMTGAGEGAYVPGGYTWTYWMGAHRRYPAKHNIGLVIDPEKYGKEHPEYFPLIGGKRMVPKGRGSKYKLRDWQPCWSNPDVPKIAIDAARKFFGEDPSRECFSLAQNDNWGWCQCKACTGMNGGLRYDYQSHRDYSPVHFRFLNKVCAALGKDFPDKKIAAYAYQCGTITPPPFKLHRNVVVHMVNDHSRWHFDTAWRAKERAFIKSWSAVATTLGFHEHHFDQSTYIPWLALKSTAEMLRECHKLGVRSYHGEEYPHWGLSTPKTYITARLLWDVDLDPMVLLKEYCREYFGAAAAEPMFRYYARLEEVWNTQPIDTDAARVRHPLRGRDGLALYTPGIMEELFGCLAQARKVAEDDAARQRLDLVETSLRLVDLYVQREDIYRRIDPTRGLTREAFAVITGELNAMHHLTLSARRYGQAHIVKNPLTLYSGLWPRRSSKWSKPQFLPMEPYYCEVGSGVAGFLVRQEKQSMKKGATLDQSALNKALHARFDVLSKLMTDPKSSFTNEQGVAWGELSGRIRDFIDGTAVVKRLDATPRIDGNLNESIWQDLPVLTITHPAVTKRTKAELLQYPGTIRAGYDDKALYIAYHCVEENLAGLNVRHKKRDSAVWDDDCADFVILPAGEDKVGFRHYIVSAGGVIFDAKGAGASSTLWTSGVKLAIGHDKAAKAYVLEMALPWSDFGKTPASGDIWRAQFSRADPFGIGGRQNTRFGTWAPSARGFNNADYLGVLIFE